MKTILGVGDTAIISLVQIGYWLLFAKKRSASIAAAQPMPAAVTACL